MRGRYPRRRVTNAPPKVELWVTGKPPYCLKKLASFLRRFKPKQVDLMIEARL